MPDLRLLRLIALLAPVAITGCVQSQWREGSGSAGLATANQMMDLEDHDRIDRFQRLAQENGVAPPQIDQLDVSPDQVRGATRPIPVIRVVFDERSFYDPGSAVPRPEAANALRIIAENMHRDVPDVRLTLLGHTDATGTDSENASLSQRRALGVMQRLVNDGVNPAQLGTVAIGKMQPIASNETAAGRARNRRVEFLISSSEDANLAVVQSRPVNRAFLRTANAAAARPARTVEYYKVVYSGPSDISEAPTDKRQVALSAERQVSAGTQADDPDDTGSPVSRKQGISASYPPPSGPVRTVAPY